MVNLNEVTNVHFIGIAGAGMRAIANVFIEKGYHVSGSDLKASPVTEQFAKKVHLHRPASGKSEGCPGRRHFVGHPRY